MWLKLPGAKRQGTKKKICFIHKILDFYYFLI
jgi:hypothetical protein